MTLEAFARVHDLPARWLELRKACKSIVARPDFWYQLDLQEAARKLALEASDILVKALTSKEET
jgi:hypothetical protein